LYVFIFFFFGWVGVCYLVLPSSLWLRASSGGQVLFLLSELLLIIR